MRPDTHGLREWLGMVSPSPSPSHSPYLINWLVADVEDKTIRCDWTGIYIGFLSVATVLFDY